MSKARVIVLSVVHQGLSKAEAARRYGVSWQWVHTLVTRYQQGGLEAVEPRSKRPATNRNATPDLVQDRIIELRKQLDADGLDAGPVTIASHLHREGVTASSTPTESTGATHKKSPAAGRTLNNDATHLSTMTRLITLVELRVRCFRTCLSPVPGHAYRR